MCSVWPPEVEVGQKNRSISVQKEGVSLVAGVIPLK